jgi:hypothetical protein
MFHCGVVSMMFMMFIIFGILAQEFKEEQRDPAH